MPEKLQRSSLIVVLLLLLWPVTAYCAQQAVYKESRPMKSGPEASQKAAGAQEPGAAQKPETPYYYDPTGKTDPFKSFIAKAEEMEAKEKRKPHTYLETLDLSQLDLIAIIVGPKGNYAMVRDSKGIGHVIQKGTPIGMNGGTVLSITEQEVTIRETQKDFRGQSVVKDIAKRLPSLQ